MQFEENSENYTFYYITEVHEVIDYYHSFQFEEMITDLIRDVFSDVPEHSEVYKIGLLKSKHPIITISRDNILKTKEQGIKLLKEICRQYFFDIKKVKKDSFCF